MEVTVRHYLPGRVRLHVPELARKAALAEAALAWLRTQPGISTARLNEACASLVIEYDRVYEPILQGVLTHLRGVSSRELATLVTASAGVKPEAAVSAILILAGSAAFLRVRLIESGWMWTVSNW